MIAGGLPEVLGEEGGKVGKEREGGGGETDRQTDRQTET